MTQSLTQLGTVRQPPCVAGRGLADVKVILLKKLTFELAT